MIPYQERKNCRVCSSPQLTDVLSLGCQAIVDWSDKPPAEVPLEVVKCGDCNLLQLRYTTNPHLLWNESYGYRSGTNETMRNHLRWIANDTAIEAGLKPGDRVIDIGCNDGTLLRNYPKGIFRVGYEPSHNVGKEGFAKGNVDKIYLDFFSAFPYTRDYGEHSAKAITAISMFYDLDDPNSFVADIKSCLTPDGVFVVQQNYVGGMLSQNAFDNICHEHLEYYSLTSMVNLFSRHDMEVYKVSQNDLNGGSFRTFICNKGERPIDKSVIDLLEQENRQGLNTLTPYKEFAGRVTKNGHELKEFIEDNVARGKRVYLYGASTRGNTLMQYYGLDNKLIEAAAERNPDKWGKRYGVTEIPMISEEQARADKPDFFLVLPWFFRDEFMRREKEFTDGGGKMIFPLPKMEVLP